MQRSTATARWRATAILASIVGAAASAYLLVEYVTGQPGVCLTGSGCDLVRASAFAYPFGIPTPLIGLLFYALAGWTVLRAVRSQMVLALPTRTALLGLAAIGATASLLLTGAEAFVIRAFCSWCLVQAGASLVLLVAAAVVARIDQPPTADGNSNHARQRARRALDEARHSLSRTARLGTGAASLAVGLLLIMGASSGTPGSSVDASTLAPAGNPHLGAGPIEVVEFADFQCPGCAAVAPILADLAASNGMTLVYRYFPLDSIHRNADASARAAAAAGMQDSFWEMSAALYARQNAWKDLSPPDADAFFGTLAGNLRLDVAQWQAAYGSSEVAALVDADRQAAVSLGLSGTPTIFIAGRRFTGPLSADGIRSALAAAAPPA